MLCHPQSRGPGSVASYTTLGSGFTAQTAGTVMSRLAQRLERQRQERLEAGSTLSGTTAYESVRPDSRMSFASSLPGPAPQQQSRGASLAQQASAARDGDSSQAAAGRAGAPLPPVAEEPTRVPSRAKAAPSDTSRPGSSLSGAGGATLDGGRVQAAAHRGSKEKMSTAEAMAAHMAAMQAATAAVLAGGAVSSARPAVTSPSSRGVPTPLPAPTGPPAGRPRAPGGGHARAPASSVHDDGGEPEDDLFDEEDEQRDDDDDDGFSDESDEPQPRLRWRVGSRGSKKRATRPPPRAPSRAASVDVEAPAPAAALPPPSVWPPPNQPPRGAVKPPETRWFGIKLPDGLVARHSGWKTSAPPAGAVTSTATAAAAAAEDDGDPFPGEWTPTRLAAAVSLLSRASACVLVATGVAAAYVGRSSGRHIAMVAVSLGLAITAIAMLASGAASRRAGPVLAGVTLILVDGTALSSFCASQAEAVMTQCGFIPPRTQLPCSNASAVRASTLVYAWALACCAVPLAAVAAMLALRLEVTDAVLRHALAARGGQLTSLARATVLPGRV